MIKHSLGFIDLESDPKNPKIKLVGKKAFQDNLRAFGHGTKVWFITETFYRQRSLEQNSTLHWYIGMIEKETGQDNKHIKSTLCKMFLEPKALLDKNGNEMANPATGEIMTYIPSTSDLTTVEMNEFWDKIRQWALDFLGLDLPLPDKLKSRNYKMI